jgi:predicted DNA-binding transcriptional regulator AlpA
MKAAKKQQESSRRAYEMAHEDDHVDGSAFAGEDFALMTVKEACADARISAATFYRLAKKDPNFPALVKIGFCTRVRSGEWRQYLGSLATADGTDNADGFQHIAGHAIRSSSRSLLMRAATRRSGPAVGNASVCRPGNAPGRTHALCQQPTFG